MSDPIGEITLALSILVPVAVAIIAWALNERGRRERDEYVRREARYQELLAALRGFYEGTPDRAKRLDFLDQVNLCWLYCPDDVIRKAYRFLETVHTDVAPTRDEDKKLALGELVAAIRQDLLSRTTIKSTRLRASDFKHFGVT